MAGRSSRGRSFRHGRHRYQWFGFQNTDVVVDSDAVDSFIVVPTTASAGEQADGTLVRSLISTTVASANLVRDPNQTLMLVLQHAATDVGGTATNVIDPTSTNAFALGDADVLGWWQLPVPINTPPVSSTQGAFITTNFESKAKRRMKMRTHSIIGNVSGFDTVDLKLTIILRCLIRFS